MKFEAGGEWWGEWGHFWCLWCDQGYPGAWLGLIDPTGLRPLPNWQFSQPFSILQLVKSLPYYIPLAWKWHTFRTELLRIVHYREYPPTPHSPRTRHHCTKSPRSLTSALHWVLLCLWHRKYIWCESRGGTSDFRLQTSRLQTSDFRPQTSDLRPQTSRLQTSDFKTSRLQTSDFRPQTSDFRLQTSDLRPQTSDLRPQTSDLRPQTSDLRPQTSDLRPQTSDLRPQTSDLRPQTSDFRLQTSDFRLQTSDLRLQTKMCSDFSFEEGLNKQEPLLSLMCRPLTASLCTYQIPLREV